MGANFYIGLYTYFPMATLLDALGVLQNIGVYAVILPFILMFALSYALFEKTKLLGENKYVNVAIATVLAFLFIAVSTAVKFVAVFLPLVSALMLIILFIILIFRFAGVEESAITGVLAQSRGYGPIIFILILFAFLSFGQLFPEGAIASRPELGDQFNITQPTEGVAGLQNFLALEQTRILFSPTIMALMVMLIIFAVATYYITREPEE